MLADGGTLPSGTALSATVCIIGGGPAGLTLAHELIGSKIDVLLLESGNDGVDSRAQDLNDGTVTGDAYAGLCATRRRQLGGTVNMWNTPVDGAAGAKYVPLDTWDFEPTNEGCLPGWPIGYSDILPHYERAQTLCGLGPFVYGADAWQIEGRRPFGLCDGYLASSVYQFGSGRQLLGLIADPIIGAQDLRVLTNVTLCRLSEVAGRRVTRAQAITAGGAAVDVRASIFVLAAGAVENARILLLSLSDGCEILRSVENWIGRCFMEHPRDTSLLLKPRSADFFREAAFYDVGRSGDGCTTCGRLGLADGRLARLEVPNFSVTLLPRERPGGVGRRTLRRLGLDAPRGGYGWSAMPDPSRYFDAFRLLINLEQRPDPENRITLSSERDALGLPRARLHWSWGPQAQTMLDTVRSIVISELESAALGKVELAGSRTPDPNAHHHAGTTRMARDLRFGVVDSDSLVHGVDNLYVAGASVFPTAGYANPTLTIVALAIRLADHLQTVC